MNEQCHSQIHYLKFTSTQVFFSGFCRMFQVSVFAEQLPATMEYLFFIFYGTVYKVQGLHLEALFTFSVVPAMCAASHVKINYLALIGYN